MKTTKHKLLILTLLSFILFSCSEHKQKRQTFPLGTVVNEVICKRSSSQSYALYLPTTYNSKSKYPIFYIFDSHARGKLVIEKYKQLAENFGFILIGSNNSKNGLSPSNYQIITSILFQETDEKFSIDKKRIYCMGFSGGARVAVSTTINNSTIRGVVGCGAGFPNDNSNLRKNFLYYGIVGNEDFNLLEFRKLDRWLKQESFNYYIDYFEGEHDWPNISIMTNAFIWIKLKEIQDNLVPSDENFIAETGTQFTKEQLDENRNHEALMLEIEKEETLLQQQYAPLITEKSLNWWKNETTKINSIIEKEQVERSSMYKRLLNYLSLNAYMYSTSYIKRGLIMQAEEMLHIYRLVDPDNSEHAYLFATLLMKGNKYSEAMLWLKQAIKLGFKDKERLKTDPAFLPLKEDKVFTKVRNSIK